VQERLAYRYSMILIVAGVSGSGKTTVGALIAGRLHWRFTDADDFHPESNVAKMRSGIPLTDDDRLPWLQAIAAWMDERIKAGESAVMTCSALKRGYRDLLLSGRPDATMVFLQVSHDELVRRLTSRTAHFFPGKLLDSQLKTLEPPQPDEGVLTVPAEDDITRTADRILALVGISRLRPKPAASRRA
jgi:gluconokinase